MSHPEVPRRSRVVSASPVYYGWVILAAGTLGLVMTTPGQTVGVSAFLDPIIRDLGLTRSSVSLAYTVGTLGGAFAMPFVGRWIDRRGPRLAVVVVSALFALACAGMSLVGSLPALLLGFTAIRGLGQGALGLVSLHAINLWFVRRRGLAAGVAGLGLAASSALFPPLVQWLVATVGWRAGYALLGLLVAITILPVGALLFRDRPELFGLRPDGLAGPAAGSGPPAAEERWTLAQARRTAIFWLLLAAGFLSGALGTALVFHHFSILAEGGLDRSAAAAVFVPVGLLFAAANLGAGVLLDRFEPRVLLPAGMGLLAASLVVAALVTGPGPALAYGATLGLMQGTSSAIASVGLAHYFGRAHLGSIRGFAFTVTVVGAAVGPVPFALGVEAFGSYRPVLLASALLPLATAAAALLVRRPVRAPDGDTA